MRRFKAIYVGILITAFLMLLGGQSHAASMGVSRGYDLDDLWARAQQQFELSKHDAVLLLESRQVSILGNGDLVTRVHRVVWISTEVGIDDHADLRIPWNSATSGFEVIALRTWMDDRWWPHESEVSETAVVETLPFAIALADDYTPMRETMLLHDGVELPCIMETIYEITKRGGAKEGADGLWVFPQVDPAVMVDFLFSVPAETAPAFHSTNGAPESETASEGGRMTYIWRMENLERIGSPRIEHPSVYAPSIAWSTWRDWEALGEKITSAFDEAAVLSDALADSLSKRLDSEPSNAAKARAIASLVNEWTRSIHYDPNYWRFAPRPAMRTWETAYGHGLDRAVLAAALFRAAGFRAEPVFRASPFALDQPDMPALSPFGDIAVLIEGLRLNAVFDPAEGSLEHANSWMYGGAVWRPAKGAEIRLPGESHDNPEFWSRSELVLTVVPGDEGDWEGTGFMSADGIFCPYDEMTGLEGEALSYLNRLIGSVIPGAKVKGFNPEAFGSYHVTVGFEFVLEAPEADEHGRRHIAAGVPSTGIATSIPSDVHLYDETRSSPVLLPGKMHQKIVLRIETNGREIVYLPEAREIANGAGSFTLTAENEDGWVTVGRELSLDRTQMEPAGWPALRALLLEEMDGANRTILIK
jgi:hypothetical protein